MSMVAHLDRQPALVLNADFRPLSYFPLSVWGWQDAIKAVFMERVNVLSEYDTVVHSPSTEFRLPSVISLKDYVQTSRRAAFTRFNVFLRDKFTCQYCDYLGPAERGIAACLRSTRIIMVRRVRHHYKQLLNVRRPPCLWRHPRQIAAVTLRRTASRKRISTGRVTKHSPAP